MILPKAWFNLVPYREIVVFRFTLWEILNIE
jgi:hypothetical protein